MFWKDRHIDTQLTDFGWIKAYMDRCCYRKKIFRWIETAQHNKSNNFQEPSMFPCHHFVTHVTMAQQALVSYRQVQLLKVPEPSAMKVEMAIEKPKRDKYLLKWLKQGLEQLSPRPTKLLILLGIRNCLRSGMSRSVYLFIRRAIKHYVVIIYAYHFCHLFKKFYPTSCCQG